MYHSIFQEALGNLSSNGDRIVPSFTKDSKKAEKMASPPPPKPQIATAAVEVPKDTTPQEESTKKPEWLAELSRKQANRRSGLFTSGPDTETNKTSSTSGTSPPKSVEKENNNKPVIASDKPHIPLKPSQIRDEGTGPQCRNLKIFLPLYFT